MRKLLARSFVLAVLGVVAAGAGATGLRDGGAAPLSWQTPITLSPLARAPSLHVDGVGNVTAYMLSGSFPSWRDSAWQHPPGGRWPDAPETPAVGTPGSSLLAVNHAGAGLLVWSSGTVLQASYRPAGGVWGTAETISASGGPYGSPTLSLDDDGNAAVAWERRTSDAPTVVVEVALRSTAMNGWLPVDTMPPGPRGIDNEPALAFERPGEVVLAWQSYTAIPSYGRLLAASRSLTSVWSPPLELTPPQTSAQDISVAANGAGTAVVSWHDTTRVWATVRKDGLWTPRAVLSTFGGTGSLADVAPAAVDATGNATLLWSRYHGTSPTWAIDTASYTAEAGWALPATLSELANGSAQPRLGGNSHGDAVAAWREWDGVNVRIAAMVRDDASGWPSSPVYVSSAGLDSESPAVVIDETGLASAVWIEGDFHGAAKASFSDGVAPMVTVTTPPDGATYESGEAVTADYSCTDAPGQLHSCTGTIPDGEPLDTTPIGPGSLTVSASDRAGNSTTLTHAYSVVPRPLAVENVTPVSVSVARFARFEASISLSRSYADPFDPEEIAVDVTFTAPSGARTTVPAFWHREYRVKPGTEAFEDYEAVSAPAWRVRFAPAETGTHTYTVAAADESGDSATSEVQELEVVSGASRGFVHVDPQDPLMLRFDSGEPYVPVGHNVAFEEPNPAGTSGTGYYERLFSSLGRAGENWSRVWMTDFNRSALEWSSGHWSNLYGGVGTYSLASAWRMDQILSSAERHGVYVQLVLNDHGQFSTWTNPRWHENPYSDANGGPVPAAQPHRFFSDPDARKLHERRLRYVVARWGAHTNLLAWELFNEVQFIGTSATNMYGDPAVRQAVVDWHQEMGGVLHELDGHDHLVSTSSQPSPVDDAVSAVPAIDLLQVHLYAGPEDELDRTLVGHLRDLQRTHGKPVIGGEIGLPSHVEGGFDPTTFQGTQADREHLTQGTHLHNTAWAAAHARSAAGSWWWGSYIAEDPAKHREPPAFPLNERLFPALAAYLHGEDWAARAFSDAELTTPASVYAVGVANTSAARIWVRDVLNGYGSGARPGNLADRVVTGADITVHGLEDGTYEVEVWDAWSGEDVTTLSAVSRDGALTLTLPDFTRDVALKVEYGGPPPDLDTDGDALLDRWEEDGIDLDGDGIAELALNEPPYSADPMHKDVFLEIDSLAGHAPQAGTLEDVETAFAAAPVWNPDGDSGIRLHALSDETLAVSGPVRFFGRGPGVADDFDDLKTGEGSPCAGHFGTPAERAAPSCESVLGAKKLAFRYVVFGHSYAEAPTSSGIAELPGNDLMVTLGGKSPDWLAAAGSLRAAEAGTLMHELGHTFGLRHGGFEEVNCKPNYRSVMSYPLQVPYVDPERPLDYSGETLASLDEARLDEWFGVGGVFGRVVFGIQGGASWAPAEGEIDWDGDTAIQPEVAADVNWIETRPDGAALPGCGPSPGQQLVGHDDWAALDFDFRDAADYADGAHESARAIAARELTAEAALETAQNVDFDGDGLPNALDRPIAFLSARTGNGDIYTVDAAGGAATRLTQSAAIDGEPDWSPDRTRIAFTSTRDGNAELYVMDADGGNVRRLTSQPAFDMSPAWSPDGRSIAFASNRGGNWDIFVMAADGSDVRRLTTHKAEDLLPAWSPDGLQLAFMSTRTGKGDIYTMRRDGAMQTRRTTVNAVDSEPAWSVAGIAFSSDRHGQAGFDIYTMAPTGGAQSRRTTTPGHDVAPSWSPDGTRIVFASARHGAANLELYTMRADGSGAARLTVQSGADTLPDW